MKSDNRASISVSPFPRGLEVRVVHEAHDLLQGDQAAPRAGNGYFLREEGHGDGIKSNYVFFLAMGRITFQFPTSLNYVINFRIFNGKFSERLAL